MENSAIAYFNEITSDCSRLKSRSVLHIRDDIINVHLLPESAGVFLLHCHFSGRYLQDGALPSGDIL